MRLFKSINLSVKSFIIADGFYYAEYSVVNAFLSLLITSRVVGGRVDIVGFVIAYYMIVRAVIELPLSNWTKHFSFLTKRNIIAFGYIFYGFFIFLLGHSTQVWHIFAIQTIIGFIDALIYPIKWPIFTRIIDKGSEELEWGLEDIASTLLPAIFTAFAGIISVSFGLEYAFLLFAILLIISGIIFLSIRRDGVLNLEVVLSDNQKSVFKRVVKMLSDNKIPFQVSGGLAAIIYGAKRPLYDIDIDVHKKDIPIILEVFKDYISKDFYHFKDGNFDIWLMTLKIDGVPIDFSQVEDCYFSGSGKNKIKMDINLTNKTYIKFDGIEIPVENKVDLIAYKSILGRETDLMDVRQIH